MAALLARRMLLVMAFAEAAPCDAAGEHDGDDRGIPDDGPAAPDIVIERRSPDGDAGAEAAASPNPELEVEVDAVPAIEVAIAGLHQVPGVTEQIVAALAGHGITTVRDLAGCATDDLAGWTDIEDGRCVRTPGFLEACDVTRGQCEALIMRARVGDSVPDCAPSPQPPGVIADPQAADVQIPTPDVAHCRNGTAVSLLEVRDGQCRYIVDDTGAVAMCCGCTAVLGMSWCEQHRGRMLEGHRRSGPKHRRRGGAVRTSEQPASAARTEVFAGPGVPERSRAKTA